MEEKLQEFKDWLDVPENFTGKCKIFGSKFSFKGDEYHCLDGPAVEYAGGSKFWFVEGRKYTKKEFNALPEVIMYKAGLGVFI